MDTIFNDAVTLITLTILEIILGIDNLIFLAVISQRLPSHQQHQARRIGLTLAWLMRLLLLFTAVWLTHLKTPLFSLLGFSFSGRDVFLIAGGLFLLAKATQEIHGEMETTDSAQQNARSLKQKFTLIVCQIVLLDVVFSLDSVLTAVGLTQKFWLMAIAITIAILVMLFTSKSVSLFILRNPTIKMLALSFLILIGMVLIADGFSFHIPRAYIYFAMAFSLMVEFLNYLRKKKREAK